MRNRVASALLIVPLVCANAAVAQNPLPGPEEPVFTDESTASGLVFTHFNGMTGKYYFPEMTGQGGGLLDYDGDGDLDVYFAQGAILSRDETMADALYPPADAGPPGDRLFRNDSFLAADGSLELRFVDVTTTAGLVARGYGMGVAVGDIDNDGWLDIYVTNYGDNQLLRNRGDGTFEDVTATSGTGDPLWGASASFLDYDGDGFQDLYVVNYVKFDVEANPRCFATSSRLDYCGPDAFDGQPDRLFRNRGDGTFSDETSRALVGYEAGPGLGVAVADFNGDDRVDLYVANDGRVNQLWINQGDGTFLDEALFAGVGLNQRGRPEASMGVDAADFDNDGDIDIFLTHLMGESNTLYVNDGGALFEDRTVQHGLASLSLPFTSFGTSWIDFDGDGLLDLLAANGAVRILEDQAAEGDPYPLRQPNQLFRNTGSRFVDVSAEAGEGFAAKEVSRGVSLGDVDSDGDADLLVHTNNGRARLLINRRADPQHWLGVAVRSSGSSPWRTGVRLELVRSDGSRTWRRTRTDGSYCSSKDPRGLIGLGSEPEVERLNAFFPGSSKRSYLLPPSDRYLVVYDAPPQ